MGFSFITPNSGALDKETGNTDTPSSAECILPGPIVFKARQRLANWWRENIVFTITSCGPIVWGERQVQRSVEYRTMRTVSTKRYSVLTELPVDFKKQRLLTRLHGPQAPHADDGESEMEQAHRKRCGARGGIRSGQCFWKIHLMAAGSRWDRLRVGAPSVSS